jgi:hypothetical protein
MANIRLCSHEKLTEPYVLPLLSVGEEKMVRFGKCM